MREPIELVWVVVEVIHYYQPTWPLLVGGFESAIIQTVCDIFAYIYPNIYMYLWKQIKNYIAMNKLYWMWN